MSLPDLAKETDLDAYQSGEAEGIIWQAQAVVRSYCGWHVATRVDETLVLDGRGGRHLWLPSLKVTDISEVIHCGTVLDADQYDWSESGYVELRGGCWTQRPRQIMVSLTHGYSPAPQDIIEVVVSIASRAIASPSGAVREQAGQVSMQWGAVGGVSGGLALLEHERAILDKYKLPPRQ